MPKLEANLQCLFNEYDLIDRYDAAARAGFKGVELQAPYPLEIDQIVERLEKNNLKHLIINSPVRDPDMRKGNIALLPDRMDLYQERTAQGGSIRLGSRVYWGKHWMWSDRRNRSRRSSLHLHSKHSAKSVS